MDGRKFFGSDDLKSVEWSPQIVTRLNIHFSKSRAHRTQSAKASYQANDFEKVYLKHKKALLFFDLR